MLSVSELQAAQVLKDGIEATREDRLKAIANVKLARDNVRKSGMTADELISGILYLMGDPDA